MRTEWSEGTGGSGAGVRSGRRETCGGPDGSRSTGRALSKRHVKYTTTNIPSALARWPEVVLFFGYEREALHSQTFGCFWNFIFLLLHAARADFDCAGRHIERGEFR